MKTCDAVEMETVAVGKENIIHLPLGLLGFEPIKKYLLLSNPDDAPFSWLQVLEDPNLSFLVISPFEVLPEYEMDLPQEDVDFLKLFSPKDALVLNIVTLRSGGQATVNLKGPVVLNRRTLMGKQVVLTNAASYSLQYPLPTLDPT